MKRLLPTLAATALLLALAAPAAEASFGLEEADVSFLNKDGSESIQAGAHPYGVATSLALDTEEDPALGYEVPSGDFKDLTAFQVPGLVGDPTAVPACATADFLDGAVGCHAASQVGTVAVELVEPGKQAGGGGDHRQAEVQPVYRLSTPPGKAMRIGFHAGTGVVAVTIDLGVSEEPPYEVIASLTDVPQVIGLFRSELTLWGVPASPAHDAERRGAGCGGGGCSAGSSEVPLITSPRACRGPLTTTFEADSWEEPGPPFFTISALTHDSSIPPSPLGFQGCGNLAFKPTIEASPTTRAASSASGLDFSLNVADEGLTNPKEGAVAASDIEKAVVALPEGFTANPSLAEGLGVCTEAQLAKETATSAPGQGCPEASKIGSVEVETPLLEGQLLQGSLFVAKPYANPFGTLIALYMTIKDPELGIKVTQALKVEPDPRTGRLITTAEGLPQLPFSHFRLHFREGARSPLISPPGCGTFAATATLYPYAGGAPVATTSAFQIISGPSEGPCPSGQAPFHPGFEAGSLNNQAGAYSPFVLRLTRKDGEQDMTKFSTVLPPGVVGKIAGLSWCPEAAIAQAKARTGPHGAEEELTSPSCPAASKIGTTLAGAGVGSQLTYVPGSLYLAGPYHGDPLSVVAITPAQAGPFDAGTVVVREALTLNPATAEVEVDGSASDPIPHILKGIPLNVRELRVDTDRPEFTLNPTGCEEEATRATLWGGGTAFAPSSETPVALSSRYQAASCAALGFAPKLAINLKGGTKRGKFPALKAIVTPRPGDANFKRAVVTLPHSAFLEQGHFGTICTRVQFAAPPGNGAACPPASIYGRARAWTPLLSEPAEGPVYLRSSNHNLPDLVVALKGPPSAPFEVELDSRIDSKDGGIRSSFEAIPDIPVSKFILEMQGGKKGLFVNSTNLCRSTNRARAKLTGQNGKLDEISPVVKPSCGKKHRKKHKTHHQRGGRR